LEKKSESLEVRLGYQAKRVFYNIRLIFLAFVILVLSACSEGVPPQTDAPNAPPFSLVLADLDDGSWQLDVNLSEPQRALMFSRSLHDYRTAQFTVLSKGAQLERIGGFDTILFDPGVMQASFKVVPYTETLNGDYTHFLPFTDGGLAIYLGGFELLRVEDEAAVAALKGDLDHWDGTQFDIPIQLHRPGPILLNGNIQSNTVESIINGNGPYVYIGPSKVVQGRSFSGVLDPGLPDWLVRDFDKELTQIFTALEKGFGRALDQKASILFAFRGYKGKGFSNTGGALPGGLLVLETSGDAMRKPNERLRGYLQWFLTHESAHLFQYLSDKKSADLKDNWILEGGANAITHFILTELDTVPDEIVQERYKEGFTYCVSAIKNSSMAEITRRNNQSHYDCGDFIFRISEAALPNHNIFQLWDIIMEQAGESETFDTSIYFAALRAQNIDAALVSRLEKFVEAPVANPAEELQEMMGAVGIMAEIKDGILTSITFP